MCYGYGSKYILIGLCKRCRVAADVPEELPSNRGGHLSICRRMWYQDDSSIEMPINLNVYLLIVSRPTNLYAEECCVGMTRLLR